MAFSVLGEFLLILGVVFVLWGAAQFATKFIGIEGSGEFGIGLVMIIIAVILLSRSKMMVVPAKQAPQQPKPEKPPSDASFR